MGLHAGDPMRCLNRGTVKLGWRDLERSGKTAVGGWPGVGEKRWAERGRGTFWREKIQHIIQFCCVM